VDPIRVYLDTNVVSRLVDLRISADRARAYEILSNLPDVRFVTSEKAREEVRRATGQQKTAVLQLLVSFLDKVQTSTLEHSGAYGEGAYGEGPYGGGWTDPVYQTLRVIFDPADAAHITHAVRSKCDYFLTLDQRTILDRVEQSETAVKEACGSLRFVTPEQLVQHLQAAP
jgi:predicted nucleic acid-binding protein